MRPTICLVAACTGVIPLYSGLAYGQQVDADQMEEIVVTAQKREERIQDVPMSISAFGGQQLENAGVSTIGDLPTLSPGVTGDITSSSQPLLAIRGIISNDFGIGGDPALGIYVDEVYAGRSAGAVREVLDLERVEILRGPQGTLFGRNTTAGAFNFVAAKPTREFEASANEWVGNWSSWGAGATVNGAVSDSVAMRSSVLYRTSGGDVKDGLNGKMLEDIDHLAGRIAGSWDTAGGAKWILSADGERDRDGGPAYKSLSFTFPTDPDAGTKEGKVYSDLGTKAKSDRDLWGVALTGVVPVGDYALTTITAVRGYNVNYAEDTDGTYIKQLHYYLVEDDTAYSEEVRFGGESGKLTWFVGANVYVENVSSDTSANYDEDAVCTGLAGAPVPITCDMVFGGGGTIVGMENQWEKSTAHGDYNSYALFTDLKWALSDQTNVTLGLRLTQDDKHINIKTPLTVNQLTTLTGGNLFLAVGSKDATRTWTEPTARLVVDHRFDNLLGYVSASRGYKSGGFNALQAPDSPFAPEFVDSYEMGLKYDGGRRLTIDFAGFYYKYKDLQVQVFDGGLPVVQNAANATGYGVELNGAANLSDEWSLDGFATWLDATYDNFQSSPGVNYAGNTLNRAPEFTFGAGLNCNYGVAPGGRVVGRVGYSYQTRVYFTPDNTDAMSQRAFGLLNARIGYRTGNGRIEVALRGENLTDTDYVTHGQEIGSINLVQVHEGDRRSYGIDVTGRW